MTRMQGAHGRHEHDPCALRPPEGDLRPERRDGVEAEGGGRIGQGRSQDVEAPIT